MAMTQKERALNIIQGKPVDVVPAFSGFGSVIVAGLQKYDLKFAHVHIDAQEMADAAAATVELCGTAAAIVPFDMAVAAEALGATMNTYAHSEDILYPTLRDKYVHNAEDIKMPADISKAGRVPLVCDAIKILKAKFGDEVAVGAWILGPYTLAGQSMDLNDILKSTLKEPAKVEAILEKLSQFLIGEAKAYIAAGADFITVREMGATSDVLSPRTFKKIVRQYSEKILNAINEVPVVYHICGDTNVIVEDMAQMCKCISVDQKNDVAASRAKVGEDIVILGNVHPWDTFAQGTPAQVAELVCDAATAGADSVWPGCDLWPDTPVENLQMWVKSCEGTVPRRKA
jgi:[methyl-Co(III) methanol-specific corrinoid protein]:coenzyme M methyltransferase